MLYYIVKGEIMKRVLKCIDKPLLISTIILFALGLIMVFSASNVTAYMYHGVSTYYYFVRQLIILALGVILAFVLLLIKPKHYYAIATIGMIGILGSLIVLLIFGDPQNDMVGWFDLGFFNVQPSEFAKIITIVWLASYYDTYKNKLTTYVKSLFPIVICVIVAALIFLEPDLGTTIIYSAIVGLIFLASPIQKDLKAKIIFIIMSFIVFGVIFVLSFGKNILEDRQISRFNFTKPCERILNDGNQVCNCYIAINNGGLTGVGLGNSTQKYLYLPEPYTDFIFAIIVEELGVLTGIGIILMYMFVLYRILRIGRKSNNRGALICYGVACYIFLHIAINLLGIFGLMPMTGVPLPFMSYGGSFTICLIASLTFVQRVSIENGLTNEKEKSH